MSRSALSVTVGLLRAGAWVGRRRRPTTLEPATLQKGDRLLLVRLGPAQRGVVVGQPSVAAGAVRGTQLRDRVEVLFAPVLQAHDQRAGPAPERDDGHPDVDGPGLEVDGDHDYSFGFCGDSGWRSETTRTRRAPVGRWPGSALRPRKGSVTAWSCCCSWRASSAVTHREAWLRLMASCQVGSSCCAWSRM